MGRRLLTLSLLLSLFGALGDAQVARGCLRDGADEGREHRRGDEEREEGARPHR